MALPLYFYKYSITAGFESIADFISGPTAKDYEQDVVDAGYQFTRQIGNSLAPLCGKIYGRIDDTDYHYVFVLRNGAGTLLMVIVFPQLVDLFEYTHNYGVIMLLNKS